MKNILVAAIFALLLVGCDRSNPVESDNTSDALYSETTMYNTAVSSDAELVGLQADGVAHDSIRHGRMLGHLKVFVGLSDEQFDSVKVYAQTMFLSLKDIRTQVHDSLITKEQARELVKASRDQFVTSVKSILTGDQIAKFERWITNFWSKHPRRHGHGGHGGRGGHGGGKP